MSFRSAMGFVPAVVGIIAFSVTASAATVSCRSTGEEGITVELDQFPSREYRIDVYRGGEIVMSEKAKARATHVGMEYLGERFTLNVPFSGESYFRDEENHELVRLVCE